MCKTMSDSIKSFLSNAVFTPVEGEDWGFWKHGGISVQGREGQLPHPDLVEEEIVEAAYYAGLEAIGAW